MRLVDYSWNKPPRAYTFAVHDTGGTWGDVTVRAFDIESAKRRAVAGLLHLQDSGLRVGFTVKLRWIKD